MESSIDCDSEEGKRSGEKEGAACSDQEESGEDKGEHCSVHLFCDKSFVICLICLRQCFPLW